ncbi:MAG: PIG-L family deacetylase [Planctomycetota bacterium]|jgi:LmbE family N-acetylglucosaminyl deacetylase
MKRPLVFLVTLAAITTVMMVACTTVRREPGMAAFYQACVDATTDAVVLNLAAHPDDEAARTLVYLRRKYGLRTYTLYSTCGGGGQNASGPEIGADLARIRTRETLAAARITGTQVRWLGFSDFGYSKTAEETLRVWGRNRYLSALDKALDEIRPDVVFTNHGTDRGHGHHRVTSFGAQELVAKRPGLPLYQRMAREVWFETPDGKRVRKPAEPDVRFPVGETDLSTGESYARQALRGWRMHRSQGMGAMGGWRSRTDTWKQILPVGADNTGNEREFDPRALPSLFDSHEFCAYARQTGVDPHDLEADLDAFGNNRPIAVQVDRARQLLPVLRRLRDGWQVPNSSPAEWNPLGRRQVAARLGRRIDALERLVLEGLGIKVQVALDQDRIPVGERAQLTLRVWSPNVELDMVRLWPPETLHAAAATPPPAAATKNADNVWETKSSTVVVLPGGTSHVWPAALRPKASITVGELSIQRQQEVLFTAVPSAELSWETQTLMLPAPDQVTRRTLALQVEWNGHDGLESSLEFDAPAGVSVRAQPAVVKLSSLQRTTAVKAVVTLDATCRGKLPVVARLKPNNTRNSNDVTARLDVNAVTVRRPDNLRIGLIRGPDDTLHEALRDLQLDFLVLDPVTLKAVDLARFTTLVIDMRAYRLRQDLVEERDRILEFCKRGGRIVCFYHQPGEWNKRENRPLLAPYELQVGRKRVSQEDAPVKFMDPKHRIWNHPNKITTVDFEGWVQERGLNFPEQWGKEWVAMLEMADAGEKPLAGGLLYADYGKGQYIYCCLVLYRQLRQGHAGAARILVNLLSR